MAAVNNDGFPLRPRFNEAPYSLGNFDNIAAHKGKDGEAEVFSLGFNNLGGEAGMVASYISRDGLVELSQLSLHDSHFKAVMYLSLTEGVFRLILDVAHGQKQVSFQHEVVPILRGVRGRRLNYDYLIYSALQEIKLDDLIEDDVVVRELQERLDVVTGLFDVSSPNNHLVSIAPIRTRPKRTYDQVTEEFTPEGEHIPFVLSGLLEETAFKETLERFGDESGLFSGIDIKKLGNKISDPIQVMIANASRTANLVDVGYGVSQALPVVVESLLAPSHSLLLLQQPEVHLHPRAQAALGSLLVEMYADYQKWFVVETHSDYIIDRVRQEIAKGRVRPDDVQILYCEKEGPETRVFPIAIDEQGNIVDPPPSYRDFFMEEEMNLLSRGKS